VQRALVGPGHDEVLPICEERRVCRAYCVARQLTLMPRQAEGELLRIQAQWNYSSPVSI
jgi:hypothetical protein